MVRSNILKNHRTTDISGRRDLLALPNTQSLQHFITRDTMFAIRLSLFLCVLGTVSAISNAAEKPNIVFVLFDDLPYAGMSALGNTRIETPHMDRLAREGMTFTRAYSEMLCAPSRFTIFTGQWSARHGHTNVGGQQYPHVLKLEPELTQPLTPKSFNLARLLQSAGYTTAIFGKWHMATVGLKPAFAKQCGFDEAVPVLSAAPTRTW